MNSHGRLAPGSLGPLKVGRDVLVHEVIACGLLSWLWLGFPKVWSHHRLIYPHVLHVLDISDDVRKASLYLLLLARIDLRPFDFLLLL